VNLPYHVIKSVQGEWHDTVVDKDVDIATRAVVIAIEDAQDYADSEGGLQVKTLADNRGAIVVDRHGIRHASWYVREQAD
jgi:hypothetical protein